jgi:hypothetical protein
MVITTEGQGAYPEQVSVSGGEAERGGIQPNFYKVVFGGIVGEGGLTDDTHAEVSDRQEGPEVHTQLTYALHARWSKDRKMRELSGFLEAIAHSGVYASSQGDTGSAAADGFYYPGPGLHFAVERLSPAFPSDGFPREDTHHVPHRKALLQAPIQHCSA